jgi:enoyl-CoA hydratase
MQKQGGAAMTTDVLTLINDGAARVRLNRPAALHALNLAMCEAMIAALLSWRDDDTVRAVLIDHAPSPDGDPKLSRGFCAGGDIRMLAESGAKDGPEKGRQARAFFHTEYRLNHLLFTYAKPTVTFMDGITMGGGVGLALPCDYRVATENTRFAMPETGVGLFPDVGGGWYLSRLPGRSGVFLALTGARIDGAECLALGLATHHLPSDRLDEAKARIAAHPDRIAAILTDLSVTPSPARITDHRAEIDRLFASDRLEDILDALAHDSSDWAAKELATLESKSPQTMKVALRQLADGANMPDFASEMKQEYAIGARVVTMHDFLEGVRAVIIDKDNRPHWHPPTAVQVNDDMLDHIFAPLPTDQEWTPL